MKQSTHPMTANGAPCRMPSRGRPISAAVFLIRGLASLTFLAAPAGAHTKQPTGPVVAIESGKLQGAATAGAGGADVEVFRGIPYAAPPIAALRWKGPQPVPTWRGVRPAVDFGANCLQKPMVWLKDASVARYSEDCLYLNLWRPAHTKGLAHGSSGLAHGSSGPERT